MIEFEKIIRVYSYQLHEIYCCDCFFDLIASKIFSERNLTSYDEFIIDLEERFPADKFVIQVFLHKILLVCKPMFKFIIDTKRKSDQLMRKSCIVDFFNLNENENENENEIKVCIVCLIEIAGRTETLKKFKLKSELRNGIFYV